MFASTTLTWLFTVVFAVAGGYSLVRVAAMVAGGGQAGDAVTEAVHVLMSAAMVAMVWAWTGGPVDVAMVVVFGAFALWFLARAAVRTRGHGRVSNLYHAVMAAAMVWMVVAMPFTAMGVTTVSAHAGGHHGAVLTLDGVVAPPLAVSSLSWLFVAALIAAAASWAGRALRPGRVRPRLDATCHVLLSLGMGGMLLAML